MRTVRNVLSIIAISAFLFACEADNDIYDDDNLIEDVKADTGDQVDAEEDNGHDEK